MWFISSENQVLKFAESNKKIISVITHLFKILETHPWETLSCLEMTQGRTPAAAISIIFNLERFIGYGHYVRLNLIVFRTQPLLEPFRVVVKGEKTDC